MVSNARLGGWETKPVDEVAKDFGLDSGEDQLDGIVIHRSGAHLWDIFYMHGTGIHQLITTRTRAVFIIALSPQHVIIRDLAVLAHPCVSDSLVPHTTTLQNRIMGRWQY